MCLLILLRVEFWSPFFTKLRKRCLSEVVVRPPLLIGIVKATRLKTHHRALPVTLKHGDREESRATRLEFTKDGLSLIRAFEAAVHPASASVSMNRHDVVSGFRCVLIWHCLRSMAVS